MIPALIIVIAIPIIIGVTIVSPFEPREIEDEQIQETPVDETPEPTMNIFYILLGIVWLFFLFRVLRILLTGKYRSSVRKQ
jgi:quinol-cytochrome oxidoreductase complex cytochrome b subunit